MDVWPRSRWYDSEIRFGAMAGRGSRQAGFALLDNLDRNFAAR